MTGFKLLHYAPFLFDIPVPFCYFSEMTFDVITGNKRFLSAVNITLSALLALTCIMLVREIITYGVAHGRSHGIRALKNSGVSPPGALKRRLALSDYSPVAEKNVFGFPPMAVTPLTAQSAQAAAGSLSLIGTVSGAWNYAIFMGDSGRQLLYRAGQMVPGLGFLKSINKDSAVVRTAGGDVKLPLKDIATIEPAGGAPGGVPGIPSAAAPASPGNQLIASEGQDSYLLNKSAVQNIIKNPTRILSDARLLPNIVNGKQEGFTVNEVKPGGFFSKLGLRNGDVLLKINNNEMSGPDMALRAFTALQGLDRVDLDIIRGGRKISLVYQIR